MMPLKTRVVIIACFSALFLCLTNAQQDDPICSRYYNFSEFHLPDRLPPLAKPHFYDLNFDINLNNFRFSGFEIICLTVLVETNDLVLNSHNLDITRARFRNGHDSSEQNGNIHYCPSNETVVFQFPNRLPLGRGKLILTFNGVIADEIEGLYRSYYLTPEGERRYITTTLFEPNYARRAFPCFDQPDLKAFFELKINASSNYTAYSNANLYNSTDIGEQKRQFIFQWTSWMSTYTLAFFVGPFEKIVGTQHQKPYNMSVVTVPHHKHLAWPALNFSLRSFNVLNSYFQREYELNKMEFFAIPDHLPGAMENFGAVTYKDDYLLIENGTVNGSFNSMHVTGLDRQIRVYEFIVHELVHQWMGNLVTCHWWSDLFVNEGFAFFFEYKFLQEMLHDQGYEFWQMYRADVIDPFLYMDSFTDRPLVTNIRTRISGFRENIDVVYNKGSAFLAMIENWIGPQLFQDSVNNIIGRFHNRTARGENVISVIAETVTDNIMKQQVYNLSSWLTQSGYPLVGVQPYSVGYNLRVNLTQQHHGSPNSGRLWTIPIEMQFYFQEGIPISFRVMLVNRTQSVNLGDISRTAIVKLNPGMAGYYRVYYTEQHLENFLRLIDRGLMSPLDRLNIVSDVIAGILSSNYTLAWGINYLWRFNVDDSYGVWTVIINFLIRMRRSFDQLPDQIVEFGRILYGIWSKVGWPRAHQGESRMYELLRPKVVEALAFVNNDQTTSAWCRRFFLEETVYNRSMPESFRTVRPIIYQISGRSATRSELDWMFQTYANTASLALKRAIRSALSGAIQNVDFVNVIYNFIEQGYVRPSDAPAILYGFGYASRAARDRGWALLKTRFGRLRTVNRYNERELIDIIKETVQWSSDERIINEVRSLLRANNVPAERLNATYQMIRDNRRLINTLGKQNGKRRRG